MTTPLTLYLTNVNDTVVSTDRLLSQVANNTSDSATTSPSTANALGWLKMRAQSGTYIVVAASESAAAPFDDHEWIYQTAALEGAAFVAGNWSGSVRMALPHSGTSATVDIHMLIGKRSADGLTFTTFVDMVLTGQTLTTTNTTYNLPSTAAGASPTLATGERLVMSVVLRITASTVVEGQVYRIQDNGNSSMVVTPGYGAGTAIITAAETATGTEGLGTATVATFDDPILVTDLGNVNLGPSDDPVGTTDATAAVSPLAGDGEAGTDAAAQISLGTLGFVADGWTSNEASAQVSITSTEAMTLGSETASLVLLSGEALGVNEGQSLSVSLMTVESASEADVATIGLSADDPTSISELAASALSATGSDTLTATESSAQPTVTVADAGIAADALATAIASTGTDQWAVTETGTPTLNGADGATAAEVSTLGPLQDDTANGAEGNALSPLGAGDTATMADAAIPSPTPADTATALEAITGLSPTLIDSFTATETSITELITAADVNLAYDFGIPGPLSSEAGAAAESVGTLVARVDGEGGTATESNGTTQVAVATELLLGVDQPATYSLTITYPDTATGNEQATTVTSVTDADTTTATDTLSVSVTPSAETAGTVEALLPMALTASDGQTTFESAQIWILGSETGNITEASGTLVTSLSIGESASLADIGSLNATLAADEPMASADLGFLLFPTPIQLETMNCTDVATVTPILWTAAGVASSPP